MIVAAAIACGGDAREGLTADSAVVQNREPTTSVSDSGTTVTDSTTVDSTRDSAGVALPTLVLIADSAAGDVLYRRKGKCLSCHGLDAKGLDRLGPNLQDGEWLHGDGSLPFLQRTIVDGVARPKASPTVMPSFATTLTPDEVYRIAAYVYTLSHPGAAVSDTTRIPIDTVPPIDTPPPLPSPMPPARSATLPLP
jgi:mono/diheme cytochrome c family protein